MAKIIVLAAIAIGFASYLFFAVSPGETKVASNTPSLTLPNQPPLVSTSLSEEVASDPEFVSMGPANLNREDAFVTSNLDRTQMAPQDGPNFVGEIDFQGNSVKTVKVRPANQPVEPRIEIQPPQAEPTSPVQLASSEVLLQDVLQATLMLEILVFERLCEVKLFAASNNRQEVVDSLLQEAADKTGQTTVDVARQLAAAAALTVNSYNNFGVAQTYCNSYSQTFRQFGWLQ